MKIINALFFVACMHQVAAQPLAVPSVPHKMTFAGITLTVRDDARREIQKDVDALWQSPKHFAIKAERAKTYFPIIEKIFDAERVPNDFKYLVLQESALIADAVSVSNAVGFWQFKDFTAIEMGLRVDDVVDERMNITSATRGAAKYIKKNNYQFNNWIYALQAYQMGAGGVLRSVHDVESGARHMEITSSTYWYVKKCLAHKIAFENAVNGKPLQSVQAIENTGKRSIEEVASNLSVNQEDLMAYNKWIRKGEIPDDRTYTVLVPMFGNPLSAQLTSPVADNSAGSSTKVLPLSIITINGVPALKANPNESMTALAKRAGISLPSFMSYNDLHGYEKIVTNAHYFIARKKSRAEQPVTTAKSNDNLWSISQQFGVSLSKLKKYNRTDEIALQSGQQVWLTSKKPKKLQPTFNHAPNVSPDEKYFSWGAPAADTAGMRVVIPASEIITDRQEIIQPGTMTAIVSTNAAPRHHIVQAGENLHQISKQYAIRIEDLIVWNQLGSNVDLTPGQQLNLFEDQDIRRTEEPQEIIHEVKPSDTLYSIARQYNVSIKEIMDWNNKTHFGLTIGDKIKVHKK